MSFALSAASAAQLIVLEETASTNDELASRAAERPLPEFTVVATMTQTAGRGRLGRTWEAPPGTALATSVLLNPTITGMEPDIYGWIPLIAGLAMARTVGELIADRDVSLKWPNDVQIEGNKVSGLLCELQPDGSVVVGAGVNLTIPKDSLPVPHATSLILMGAVGSADELADLVLANYLRELAQLWGGLGGAGSSAEMSGIHDAVSTACSTLGKPIRLSLPDGTESYGTALSLDATGRLRVRMDADGDVQAVAAGDVTHLRYE